MLLAFHAHAETLIGKVIHVADGDTVKPPAKPVRCARFSLASWLQTHCIVSNLGSASCHRKLTFNQNDTTYKYAQSDG